MTVDAGAVAVPSYPGEPRPTSHLRLEGGGHVGLGEHVGWSIDAHRAFAERAVPSVLRGRLSVGDLSARLRTVLDDPYDRAALEAAAIDLALHQAGRSLADLAGVNARPTRYVISFSAPTAPRRTLEEGLGDSVVRAKLDVAPEWSARDLREVAATGRVAIFDWKRGGTDEQHAQLREIAADSLQEDPGPAPCLGSPAIADRRSVDDPFRTARSLEGQPPPAAANLKPARMGGVLEAIEGAARCHEAGIPIYFGGMFELGPGRRQLLALASVLCPEGPNDIAPIPRTLDRPAWDELLAPPRGPGFGDFPRDAGALRDS